MNPPDQTTWIARSYGKINLGLQVLDRLPNGYHQIATGFCFIEWSDRFSVTPSDKLALELNTDTIPADESNLVIKAIRHLQKYADFDERLAIDLEKHIPHAAGLGGGSSNAATILRMINKMADLGLSNNDLADLSFQLGADIPFFIRGETGIAHGIGNEITPVVIQPDTWIVTVFPNKDSSTAEAYKYCQPNPEPDFDLQKTLTETPVEDWRYMLYNDLEQAVIPRIPEIGDIRDQLYELGALYSAMSGSGSAVFGLFDQEMAASDALNLFMDYDYPSNLTPPHFRPDLGIYRMD